MPESVRQFGCLLRHGAHPQTPAPWDAIALPPDLHEAPPARQLQFRAGRWCALRALESLEGRAWNTSLPRVAGGAPSWPRGITGSITHAGEFVSAAVGRIADVQAIGIDTEPVIVPDRAAPVSTAVAWPSELAHARAAGCDRRQAVTLVFSAKESLFKCLYASVGQFFDYRDIRLVAVDAAAGTFTARVVRTLSDRFPAQTLLNGRFEVDGNLIHTGTVLAAVSPTPNR